MRRTLLAAIALLNGCACDTVPESALTSCHQVVAATVATDILFVVDDSSSMNDEQDRLRQALSNFITVLEASPIADDYRIGVTNTSVKGFKAADADYSRYASGPSWDLPYPAGALVSVDPTNLTTDPATWGDYFWSSASPPGPGFHGPRNLAYQYMDAGDTNLVADFQNDVLVGTFGSLREQPFEAMRLALTTQLASPTSENFGFLRPGARLAVIFISDEDDCSGPTDPAITTTAQCESQRTASPSVLTPVQAYVDFLKGPIAGQVRDVVVGAVVGVTCTGGVCTNTMCATAQNDPPANRFLELLSAFDPARNALASICDPNFDAALAQFASVVLSQSLPLSGDVADPNLLVVSVEKAAGSVECSLAPVGTPDAASADVVYTPSRDGYPARLLFQNGCTLAPGDRISIDVICAG